MQTIRDDYAHFFARTKSYTRIEALDRDLVAVLIDRIKIGEKELPPGLTIAGPKTPYRQSSRIFYKFIGELPAEEPMIEVVRAANF